jgi:hypothetical protein
MEYFEIDVLYYWIKEKKYLSAIEIKTGHPVITNFSATPVISQVSYSNEEVHVVSCMKKVYLCPRQIGAHHRHAELCGAACHKRQAVNDVVYEDVPY